MIISVSFPVVFTCVTVQGRSPYWKKLISRKYNFTDSNLHFAQCTHVKIGLISSFCSDGGLHSLHVKLIAKQAHISIASHHVLSQAFIFLVAVSCRGMAMIQLGTLMDDLNQI